MKVVTEKLRLKTKGHTDVTDITGKLSELLSKQKMNDGNMTVFVVGSTASITTIEYEPGLLKDLPEALERLAPSGKPYHHDAAWGDNNGYAHIRASMIGPTLVIPFSGGKLLLGTWQQVVLVDFDNRPREREVVVQFVGE
ncbi:MAG TPA: secondary thiamine-phosphate synthase enzyme YjbQ [Bacteroidota bacterium]